MLQELVRDVRDKVAVVCLERPHESVAQSSLSYALHSLDLAYTSD